MQQKIIDQVQSHLEYAGALWNPNRKGDIKHLEKVQMRATKLANNVKHLSYENRLKKLKLPTLKYTRLRGDIIKVYKYDKTCSLELKLYQSVHATRTNSLKLKNTRCHYDFMFMLLWSPYVIGQTIIFLPCDFYLSFFLSSPNLSGRRLDVYHTFTQGVALV